jgi:hypothetical protein
MMNRADTLVITNLYGLHLTPNPRLVRIRDKKVEAMKKAMGDKYLIAKSMQRLTKFKGVSHE